MPDHRLLRPAHGPGRVDPGAQGQRVAARLHGVGDVQRYNARMAAVEYAIEHDDGQSMRALDKADVILVAPSRCGKTPTTMYLALAARASSLPTIRWSRRTSRSTDLPRPVRDLARPVLRHDDDAGAAESGAQRSAGPTLAMRPSSSARYELRRAEAMYRTHRLPVINSSTKSVEEMSTVILQTLSPKP